MPRYYVTDNGFRPGRLEQRGGLDPVERDRRARQHVHPGRQRADPGSPAPADSLAIERQHGASERAERIVAVGAGAGLGGQLAPPRQLGGRHGRGDPRGSRVGGRSSPQERADAKAGRTLGHHRGRAVELPSAAGRRVRGPYASVRNLGHTSRPHSIHGPPSQRTHTNIRRPEAARWPSWRARSKLTCASGGPRSARRGASWPPRGRPRRPWRRRSRRT